MAILVAAAEGKAVRLEALGRPLSRRNILRGSMAAAAKLVDLAGAQAPETGDFGTGSILPLLAIYVGLARTMARFAPYSIEPRHRVQIAGWHHCRMALHALPRQRASVYPA